MMYPFIVFVTNIYVDRLASSYKLVVSIDTEY